MFSKLLHLYTIIDQAVAQIRDQFPAEVSCGPGCADCCHAMFDISAVEAAYLASLLDERLLTALRSPAEEALGRFQEVLQDKSDPAAARIRCPLLGDDNRCRCYPGRPMNCRTYGTPTVIQGKGHVCGLSGFDPGLTYPTINLEPLQQSLYHYSLEVCGQELGTRRFPLAQVILTPQKFLVAAGGAPPISSDVAENAG